MAAYWAGGSRAARRAKCGVSRTAPQIRRLPDPPAQAQAAARDEIQELRHGVGPIPEMQQRVGQAGLVLEIGRGLHQRPYRVSRRQGLQRLEQVRDLGRADAKAKAAAIILQQIDAGATMGRIKHQVHRALRRQHRAQGSQPGIRVRQVMQDAGADNLVEFLPKFAHALDRKLPQGQVQDPAPVRQGAALRDAGLAGINTQKLRAGPAQGVAYRLHRAAAGDQDARVVAKRPVGPEQVMVGAQFLGQRRAGKLGDTAGIGVTFIEGAHRGGDLVVAGHLDI
nr:hypothetical protein [Paracoccus yeei]